MPSELIEKAKLFAARAHTGQVRKYTGEPYVSHCLEVARIVESVGGTESMICAALLHDTVEDTGTPLSHITQEFGEKVSTLVAWLTDVSIASDGNRRQRKEIDRQHTALAPAEAKTIKLADLISNSKTIVEHDKDFAKVYIREKILLLEVLKEGNPQLYQQAEDLVKKAVKELNLK